MVRSGSKLEEARVPANVKVLGGDVAYDPEFVESCIAGQDIIFCCLGYKTPGLGIWNSPQNPGYLEKAAKNIVAAARKQGVKKICVVSAAGVGDSYEKIPLVLRTVAIGLTSVMKVAPLMEKMEKIFLDAQELDVCIVRSSTLTDGPKTGTAKVVDVLGLTAYINRGELARWMLEEASREGPFSFRTPMLSQ